MGATNDVAKALQTADLFVLSSDYEGMPNALMEAMAAGVPCISTDCPCGGPRELITHKKNGILVSVGDVALMTEAMKSLLQNKEYCNRLGKAVKLRASNFKYDKILRVWKEYIQQ